MNYIADTNIIVRLLVQDDAKQVGKLVELIHTGKVNLILTSHVIIETCRVLQSRYNLSNAKIASALCALLQTDEVIQADEWIEEALALYSDKNVDILDAYLAVRSKRLKTPVLSWDQDFRKLDCEWYTPSELNGAG